MKIMLLGLLLQKHPHILKVLHEYGIHFCSGCYWTLMSPPERAAAYHAVPNRKKFLTDLRKAIKSK